jgi:large subunit ribosomal protein L24
LAVRKIHVKRGDMVRVIAGEDRGRTGKVLRVLPAKGRVIVEGVNIVKKHRRATRNVEAGIVEQPAPIDSSNVMLICPSCNQAGRFGVDRSGDGKAVRVCKKCGKPID